MKIGQYKAAGLTLTEGQDAPLQVDISGNLKVTGALTANQSVNLAQVNGVTTLTGTGVTGTGAQRVTVAVDSATVAGSATLPGGTNIIGKFGIDQTTPGTTNLVSAGQGGTWTVQPGNTANTTPWLFSINQGGNSAAVFNGGASDGNGLSNQGLLTFAVGEVYNGTSWDRQRGDAGGTVAQPYAMTGDRWQYAAAASGISNTTTAVTFKAAHGTLRNYITAIQMTSEALGAATELAIRDGAGGTVLWRTKIGTAGIVNGISIVFPVPLKGTAATLLEVVTLTASITGAVYFNSQGFVAA